MKYRTKNYIAADWTGDRKADEQLHKWNNSRYWGLSFQDAHDITQSNDSSKNFSIKASLRTRLDISKLLYLLLEIELNRVELENVTIVLKIMNVTIAVTRVLLNMSVVRLSEME